MRDHESNDSETAPKVTITVAVDTGGTFTDLLFLLNSPGGTRLERLKLPSTPDDPATAVLAGVRALLASHLPGGAQWHLVHGSTVATNALLEGKAAAVALVTNRGFQDVLEIGRQNRPQLYALEGFRPPPPVPRGSRLGIAGRVGPGGERVEPLDPEELAALPQRVRETGAASVAVVLLHAYALPDDEEAVGDALAPLGLPVSLSSRVLPEYREYERTSTTVVNAAVMPVMARYLGRLEREAGAARVRIMGSSGGSLSIPRAVREPVHTILSGPAGGVVGALARAREAGAEAILTFDMGGTSTDVSLAQGRPGHTREFRIAGQPVAIPVMDIHTVGAGGGSLAQLDPGGALRVGPGSASAHPGPVGYGRGGRSLTVTDAHLWLGRLPPEGFLGGKERLHRELLEDPLGELAARLGCTPEEAASGILEVADAAMERALRVISVERGHHPRDFLLVAFGGAGPLHAASLAGRLGTAGALIPPDPGLLSAYGMLAAPVSVERTRTVLLQEDRPGDLERMEERFRRLEAAALPDLVEEGVPPEAVVLRRRVEARFRGQSHELPVPAAGWVEAFRALHRERYGYAPPATPVEAVTLVVELSGPAPELPFVPLPEGSGPPPLEPHRIHVGGRWVEGFRVWRDGLSPGHRLEGPGVVMEYSGTTWLPPGWGLEVHPAGGMFLRPL